MFFHAENCSKCKKTAYLDGHRAVERHPDFHNFHSNVHIYDKLRVLHKFERLGAVLAARIGQVNSDRRCHVRHGTALQPSLSRMLFQRILVSNYQLSIDRRVLTPILGVDSRRQSHLMDRDAVDGSDEARRDGAGHFALSDVYCGIRTRLDEQHL